jgi:hypothetical protein
VTERERIRAFAVAAGLVVAVVVVLSWALPGSPEQSGSEPAHKRQRATIQDPAAAPADEEALHTEAESQPPPQPEPAVGADEDLPLGVEPPPQATGLRAQAEEHARVFLLAFFRYEVGDLSRVVQGAIRTRAAPRLAHALLARPPRLPDDAPPPAPARVIEIDGAEPAPGGGFEVIALVERDGRRSPLVVTVERRDGRWLATTVG